MLKKLFFTVLIAATAAAPFTQAENQDARLAALEQIQKIQVALKLEKKAMLDILPIIREHSLAIKDVNKRAQKVGVTRGLMSRILKADRRARKALKKHLTEEQIETYMVMMISTRPPSIQRESYKKSR